MKKQALTLLLALLTLASFGQQWTGITKSQPSAVEAKLLSSSATEITIDMMVPGFFTTHVNTPNGDACVISVPKAVSVAAAGEPSLPMISIPVAIDDDALMNIRVLSSDYTDFEGMEIAPSKGDFPRNVNPDDVPYTYGNAYQQDAFFPSQLATLDEPYIHRDVRGQNILVTPYLYNPVTKTLRVYHHLTLSMVRVGTDNRNIIANRSASFVLDPEFKAIYESRYLNYRETMSRYNAIQENGELLIICHDAFMNAMAPFVTWKKQIGRPTTMVGTSTTGNTSSAIKTYIENYYATHPNLTDILLVGDVAQIPGMYVSAGSGYYGYSGYGDLPYGQTVGNDSYNEVIVGRFCCETEAQVTNHVNKVLNYERDLDATATWLSVGSGVSKNEGAGSGHYGESDYQHIDNIRNDLLAYGYTNIYRDYQNVTGTTASNANGVSQHINEGLSIINYCNHGSETSWGVFSYSNSHVNALTNDYMLPYIISVACLNGKYDHGGNGCFAEAWMRATNNSTGNPTGAIGGMFSYISQPWTPPQYGQDEMIDILVESISGTIRRTMGGVSINGNLRVLDLGANSNENKGTYNCWILFGDPTLTLRNAVPTVMGVTHAPNLSASATTFTVNATNGNDALATLTYNGEILGSAPITNGTATLNITAPGQPGTATLTVFGYNKVTYTADIIVSSGGNDPLSVAVSAASSVIASGRSTTLNAQATGGNWTFNYAWSPATSLNNPNIASPTASPTTTTTYTCTVTSGSQTQTGTCTVQVVCAPTNFSATLNGSDASLSWSAANPAESYKVYRNNTMIAQNITTTSYTDSNLQPGTYTYEIATVYQGITSPKSGSATVTIEDQLSVTATASANLIPLGVSTTLTATVSAGTGTTTYHWTPEANLSDPNAMSPTATPTETTTYTVTVTRNGNTATAETTIEVATPPTEISATLNGDQVELQWEAAALVDSYTVYHNGTVLEANLTVTQYTVEGLENGEHCFTVSAVYQNVESPVSEETCVTIFECMPPENFRASYFSEDGVSGALLVWEKNQGVNLSLNKFNIYRGTSPERLELIAHQVNVPFNYLYQYRDENAAPGEYYYAIGANYGDQGECLSDTLSVTITKVSELADPCLIYPNPTTGKVTVTLPSHRGILRVINAFGQTVYSTSTQKALTIIDLSTLSSGVYMLYVETEQGRYLKKIVLENF